MAQLIDIQRRFHKLGIDTSQPGFYDEPAFIKAERKDPAFLNHYAAFLNARKYEASYLARVRKEIPLIASICHHELVADGRLGACIDIGMILSRILEREGIWNYMVKGSLTINFPTASNIERKYFWSYDIVEAGRPTFPAAHTWLVAPPFAIVDIAIRQQPYDEGQELLPPTVITDQVARAKDTLEDVFSPKFLFFAAQKGMSPTAFIQKYAPNWPTFTKQFPPNNIQIDGVGLTYFPVGIGAPDATLENIKMWRCNGRWGVELYHDLVVPALSRFRSGTQDAT